MSLWRHFTYGLRNLTNRSKHDRDVAEEVEQYFEEAVSAWEARGLSVDEAKKAARLEMGNFIAVRERVSSYGWENVARTFVGDLRFAFRQLLKHPAFTATATLTLALGIGANTAIFTVVQSILLAPLPYAGADRLTVLNTHWTDSGHTAPRVTGPDAVDIRNQAQSFEAVSLYSSGNLGVELRDHSVYTVVTSADANFAKVFSLQPIAGRLFTDAEAHRAALVGERFARDQFGSVQAALGQTLRVENEPLEITGCAAGVVRFSREDAGVGGLSLPAGVAVADCIQLQSRRPPSARCHPAEGAVRTGWNLAASRDCLSH